MPGVRERQGRLIRAQGGVKKTKKVEEDEGRLTSLGWTSTLDLVLLTLLFFSLLNKKLKT